MILQNIRKHLSSDTASHPTGPKPSPALYVLPYLEIRTNNVEAHLCPRQSNAHSVLSSQKADPGLPVAAYQWQQDYVVLLPLEVVHHRYLYTPEHTVLLLHLHTVCNRRWRQYHGFMKNTQKKQRTQIKWINHLGTDCNGMDICSDRMKIGFKRKLLILNYMDVRSCSTWSYTVTSGYVWCHTVASEHMIYTHIS